MIERQDQTMAIRIKEWHDLLVALLKLRTESNALIRAAKTALEFLDSIPGYGDGASATALRESIDAASGKTDPLTEMYLYSTEPISTWFELTYAQFLTVPRLVMESMPLEWQQNMALLLHEMDETFDWRPKEGRYWVRLKDAAGRFTDAPLNDYRRGSVEHLRRDQEPFHGEHTGS